MEGWEITTCTVCGETEAAVLFRIEAFGAAVVRCASCGLRRLDPRPTAEELAVFYGADYYAYVGRRRAAWKQAVWDALRDASSGVRYPALRLLAEPVARRLFDINVPMSDRRQRVVDVGCGYGDLLIYLKARGADVQGVELDARAAQTGARYGIPIHVGDLVDLELPPASVDVAILQHSLEHVPDPAALAAELGRIVKPGGTLHIALPNGASAGLGIQRDRWGCLFAPEHFWYFDESSIARLLAEAGFAVARVGYDTIWANHLNLWRHRAREIGATRALREAVPVLAQHLQRRNAADILRVVARR